MDMQYSNKSMKDIKAAQAGHIVSRLRQRYHVDLKDHELEEVQLKIKKGKATLIAEDGGDAFHGATKLYKLQVHNRYVYFLCNAKKMIKTVLSRNDVYRRYPAEDVARNVLNI